MTRELEGIFRELGLAQYLDAFVDQGFDSWDTILDIQESDLDALGVKLGHRRKLQRRIANARGIAPTISLASPAKSNGDDAKSDGGRPEQNRVETNSDASGITKRKYRRHPKPDENAPERPPSAYVLFSNKMREDLKSHNLTFTEIAKLVGENWQSLPPGEKEAYENQANAAKEKYHRDLTDYKKTPEYRKYALYLQDFKEKQAKQNQDASKRPKIEPARLRHGSTSSSATPLTAGSSRSGSGSGSRSGSERMQGSEPPPNRQDGMMPDGHYQSTGMGRVPPSLPMEDSRISPRSTTFEPNGHNHPPRQDRGRGREGAHRHLPSLSDMLEDGRPDLPGGSLDGKSFITGLAPTTQRRTGTDGPAPQFFPPFRHEESSTGSTTSGSTSSGFGRSSADGPLPIHALLSNRSVGGPGSATYSQSSSPTFSNTGSASEPGKPAFGHRHGPQGYALEPMKVEQLGDGDILMTSVDSAPQPPSRNGKDGFDGMSALLRAGELVSRHDGP